MEGRGDWHENLFMSFDVNVRRMHSAPLKLLYDPPLQAVHVEAPAPKGGKVKRYALILHTVLF